MSIFPASETVAKVLENNNDYWKLSPKQNKLIRTAEKNGNGDLGDVHAKTPTLAAKKFIQLFPPGTIRVWLDPM